MYALYEALFPGQTDVSLKASVDDTVKYIIQLMVRRLSCTALKYAFLNATSGTARYVDESSRVESRNHRGAQSGQLLEVPH